MTKRFNLYRKLTVLLVSILLFLALTLVLVTIYTLHLLQQNQVVVMTVLTPQVALLIIKIKETSLLMSILSITGNHTNTQEAMKV